MPVDYSTYPPNWQEIRARILMRAQNCCEICMVPNGLEVMRDLSAGNWYTVPDAFGMRVAMPYNDWMDLFGSDNNRVKPIRIVLTIAHLDHDIQNNEDRNLKALCQQCHLRHDALQHANTRRRNRDKASGQASLFGEGEVPSDR
jgi:hypothetical protein